VPLPEGRKQYTKTKPMNFEEFSPVLDWWDSREDNEHAWKVSADDMAENNYNLDIKNPNKAKAEECRAPEEIVASIVGKEKRIFELLEEINDEINRGDIS
jgi:type I restriction enzyme M protein